MRCSACQSENPAGKKFCGDCGATLGNRCPRCGADNPANKKFCGDCGAELKGPGVGSQVSKPDTRHPKPDTPSDTRKIITVIFADLMGSTALHERLDPESVNRVMDAYYRAVRGPVEAAGGTVVQLLGDGVLCAFGIPLVAEDDALRAVRAAVGIQQAFRAFLHAQQGLSLPIGLRVAVNTGEVVVSEEHAAGIGDPLNVAARLQQEAQDGEVLIGQATRRLVADAVTLEQAGVFALKGRSEAVTAYRVVSLDRPAGAAVTPFVGREEELQRLMAVYDAAVAESRARLAVVLGSPGLGKSRLLDEIGRRLADGATVLKASCDAAGGTTFTPIAQAVLALLGVPERAADTALRSAIDELIASTAADPSAEGVPPAERARIVDGVAALLAGTPGSPEETFFVVRRFLTALSAAKPVLLAIDDLHWAEPLLLDLVEHIVQWGRDLRVMVLVGARPELRTTRSALATRGTLVDEVITMTGLDAAAATQLAANVIGAGALPAAVAGRVLATSEGNPLFVCELARMLVSDGVLTFGDGHWTTAADLTTLDMPPTIHALLAARIERLRPEERTVLERAAVIGRQFSRTAVAHLLGESADLDTHLEALRRGELIEPDSGWFLGEPALRFHHILIRDAAYRRVLKGTRADLHERLANWILDRIGDAVDHDETIGFHLEHAHRNRLELGPLDAHARALGERAAERLGAAGRRALARDDVALAAGLLGRALARLDPQDPARGDLGLDWCEALLAAGEVASASDAIAELARCATDKGLGGYGVTGLGAAQDRALTPNPLAPNPVRLQAWQVCFAGQLAVLTDSQSLRATAEAVADAAEQLAGVNDAAGEAKAHTIHAQALSRLGQIGACEAALDRALAAARRARDRRRANTVLAGAPVAALWGPSPVTRASGRCLDVVRVLRITQGAPAVEAVALRCQAVLEMLRGRGEAARRMIASARRLVEELGSTQQILETDVFGALIDLLAGDAGAAETALRSAYEGLRERGLVIDAARAAALLGRALLAQDRADEAEALSRESEALAGDDLKAAIAWRGVRAQALACRGLARDAVVLARAAVDIAAGTDALLDHADARTSLAAALRAAGQHAEGEAEERRALELWEAKGATVLVERVRRATMPSEAALAGDRAATAQPRHRRRPPSNTATAAVARWEAAVTNGNLDAFDALIAQEVEIVHHATGSIYGREAALVSFRGLIEAGTARVALEPIAALGDTLALCRNRVRATGYSLPAGAGDVLSFGASEMDAIQLVEVDEQGRTRRSEVFPADKLGAAITRLYERGAALLPEGPAREAAERRARAAALMLAVSGAVDLNEVYAPDVVMRDHRVLGFGTSHGIEKAVAFTRILYELADDIAVRVDEILALEAGAFLLRATATGIDRASGGRFERPLLQLRFFGTDGRMQRVEWFDVDREDEALARFDACAGSAVTSACVRANEATACTAAIVAAFRARDLDGIRARIAVVSETIHHSSGTSWPTDGAVESWRLLLEGQDPRFELDPLATLGDSLALCRQWSRASGPSDQDAGDFEMTRFVVWEVDSAGCMARAEIFADDRLADAIARLYTRHAERLPDGAGRTSAEATAQMVTAQLRAEVHPEHLVDPDFEFIDHRPLGLGTAHGTRALLRGAALQRDLATGLTVKVHEILMLRPDALLLRWTTAGTLREGGGSFERPLLMLWTYGPDGRLTRIEWFDPTHAEAALARGDGLAPERTVASWRARRVQPNAATRNHALLQAAVNGRDEAAIADLFAELTEAVHHPTGTIQDREAMVASFSRALSAASGFLFHHEPVATLGDALALVRQLVSSSGIADDVLDVGPLEIAYIILVEAEVPERRLRTEFFAADRQGDAIVRLYARWAERATAAERGRAAMVARAVAATSLPNPDALLHVLAPDLAFEDRRRLGMGAARGADRYVRGLRTLLDAERDFVNEDEMLVASPQALLLRRRGRGTLRATGGAVEHYMLMLWVYGADGRITHIEMFDPECESEALARIDALTNVPANEPPRANAAWRTTLAANQAWRDRRWDDVVAIHHPQYRLTDRRRVTGVDLHGDDFVHNLRLIFDMPGSDWHTELIASRGENLVLVRALLTASFAGQARTEWEHLTVAEYDAQGRRVAMVVFDMEDLDAAYAELDARHRVNTPTAAAGDALARWLRPNAAVAAHDRLIAAFETRDWEAMRARFAPDSHIEEKRALLRTPAIGGDTAVDALRAGVAAFPNLYAEQETHSLYGDRIALERQKWSGGPDGGRFEMRMLSLLEADAEGRVRALVSFDPDALSQASREATERWIAIDPSLAPVLRTTEALFAAFHARHEARIRAFFAPDVVFDDRRRTGFGRLEGIDTFIDSLRAGWRLTRTSTIDVRVHLRIEPWGSVAISHEHGTLLDGGTFETLFCSLVLVEEERFRRCELFEGDAAEEALARFEELRAERQRSTDPLRIPPNVAVHAMERVRELALAEDWSALRDHCAPAYRFEDRRRLLRNEGDRDMLVANSRHVGRSVWEHARRTLLATSGDRLCLHRTCFEGDRDGGHFLIESLEVTEVDDEGRLLTSVVIDPDDRRAAAAEMMERYMRGEGAQRMPASLIAFLRALHAYDLTAMRAALDPSFTFVDHRRTGLGLIGNADEYIASVAALHEQSADAAVDVLYHVAVAEHGALSVGRTFGTLREGGPFESIFVRLNRYEDGRSLGTELFEIDQMERAKARFEELGRAYATRRQSVLALPANLATQAEERWGALIDARDFDALRELFRPDLVWEDRRRIVGVSGGREELLANVRLIAKSRFGVVRRELVATAGTRLSLTRAVFARSETGAQIEIEVAQLIEVDGAGRIATVIQFDPDNHAAHDELAARFAAGEAAACPAQPVIAAFGRTFRQRDWVALRRHLADDLVVVDHTHAGFDALDADGFVTALRAQVDRAPDVRADVQRIVAWNEGGRVDVCVARGTMPAGGGSFETVFVRALRVGDTRIARVEIFGPGDLERARACGN